MEWSILGRAREEREEACEEGERVVSVRIVVS